MDGRESAATQTPFSSASTATLDEVAEAEKGEMPIDPESDVLSQKELEKDLETGFPEPAKSTVEGRSDLVEFDGPDDPENPRNFSKRKRWGITLSMGLMTFVVTFSSSIYAVAIEPVAKEYHIGYVTSTLGVSL